MQSLPVPPKASQSDPATNRLDELTEEPLKNSQKRLLSPLTGNDMNELAPVPVVPFQPEPPRPQVISFKVLRNGELADPEIVTIRPRGKGQ